MIRLNTIPLGVKRYCTHCDAQALYEIEACNPKVIQQSTTACLCKVCADELRGLLNQTNKKKLPRFMMVVRRGVAYARKSQYGGWVEWADIDRWFLVPVRHGPNCSKYDTACPECVESYRSWLKTQSKGSA